MTSTTRSSAAQSPQVASRHNHHGWHAKPPPLLKSPRGAVRRLLFRSPIVLYWLGLGRLLEHEFLLLTHAGRRTGRVRQTVLKVLRYDPETQERIIVSAWGPTADWYRNIQAWPALEVCTGRDWYVPQQRRFARPMLGQIGVSVDVPEAERRALVRRCPFIGLRPQSSPIVP
jgi:deazaflavin-dependent oxidoreductase (nitroreductase family)